MSVISWKARELFGSPTKMQVSSTQHSTIDPEKSTVRLEARMETRANNLYSPGGTITFVDNGTYATVSGPTTCTSTTDSSDRPTVGRLTLPLLASPATSDSRIHPIVSSIIPAARVIWPMSRRITSISMRTSGMK